MIARRRLFSAFGMNPREPIDLRKVPVEREKIGAGLHRMWVVEVDTCWFAVPRSDARATTEQRRLNSLV